MIIRSINRQDLGSCATLNAEVFASAPWLEPWTASNAFDRLGHFFESKGFAGILVEEDGLLGWPEKETAVGVSLEMSGTINVVTPFGLESLFAGYISHNPKRSRSVFLERLTAKQWLSKWPRLEMIV